jgi:toxin ParE1/3/4
MAAFAVEFAPEAVQQLEQLEEYIAGQGSPRVASTYVDAIVSYCESLRSFPNRGTRRDDIRPGLRVTN